MTDRSEMFDKLKELIGPFNKKGVELSDATTFAGDLSPEQQRGEIDRSSRRRDMRCLQ